MPVNGWDRGTLGELRGAIHRREGAAVVAALEGRSLDDVLQLAGDGLLAARAQGVPGADALAARCAALLRERRLDGDAELADVLEDPREDDLRPLAATSTS